MTIPNYLIELSLSFDEEGKKHVRKNSLDDPLENFNFEEQAFVETAVLELEDSESNTTDPKSSRNLGSDGSSKILRQPSEGQTEDDMDDPSPISNTISRNSDRKGTNSPGKMRTSKSMPRIQEELGDILKELDSEQPQN